MNILNLSACTMFFVLLLTGCATPPSFYHVDDRQPIEVYDRYNNKVLCLLNQEDINNVIKYLNQRIGWVKPSDYKEVKKLRSSPYFFWFFNSHKEPTLLVEFGDGYLLTDEGTLTIDPMEPYRIRNLTDKELNEVMALVGLKGTKKTIPPIKDGENLRCLKK